MEAERNAGPDIRKIAFIWLGGSLLAWAVLVLFMGALVLSGQVRQAEDEFIAQANAVHRHVELGLKANEHALAALAGFIEAVGDQNPRLIEQYARRLLDGFPQIQQASLLVQAPEGAVPQAVQPAWYRRTLREWMTSAHLSTDSLALKPLLGGRTYKVGAEDMSFLRKAVDLAGQRRHAAASRLHSLPDGGKGYLLVQPLRVRDTSERAHLFLVLEVAVASLLPAAESLPTGMTALFRHNDARGASQQVRVRPVPPTDTASTSVFPSLRMTDAFAGDTQPFVLTTYRRLGWGVIQPHIAVAFVCAALLGLLMACGYARSRIRREQSRRLAERKLYQLANYDSLTALPNRNLFKERLQRALLRAQRYSTGVALCFIDLDGFKAVNDSAGHDAGDRLLQLAARRLSAVVRAQDTVARLAGDEFVVVLEDVRSKADAERVLRQLRESFVEPFVVADFQFMLTASIGVAVYPEDGTDPVQLLRRADTRMYASKHPEWVGDAKPSWLPEPAELTATPGAFSSA